MLGNSCFNSGVLPHRIYGGAWLFLAQSTNYLMNIDHTSRMLSESEMGLRTDSVRLQQLDRDFGVILRRARDLGLEQNFSAEWDTSWIQRWSMINALLLRITGLVNAMDEAIRSSHSDRLKVALKAWESIQNEGLHLVDSMSAIRMQARALNASARTEWKFLTAEYNTILENMNACSQALRVKLRLLAQHPLEDKKVEAHQSDLEAASIALDKEHHQAGGFLDVIKGLFLWVESPEERVKSEQAVP